MIDYLSLTLLIAPDNHYLETHGEITEDVYRSQMYRYMCVLDKARVLYYPHKFKDTANAKMPFTIIILNPKNFVSYQEMEDYIYLFIDNFILSLQSINISRIDIAADIDGINVKPIIAMLHVKGVRSFRIIEDTIYAGKNPKTRVYNKLNEIRHRLKKGQKVSESEKGLLDAHKELTRFEVAISKPKINLQQLKDDPLRLVSYFDKLSFVKFGCSNPCGVMQAMYKHPYRGHLSREKAILYQESCSCIHSFKSSSSITIAVFSLL